MIVTKENERLYLTSWNYNCARILSRLAEIATAHGAEIVDRCKPALISNRTADGAAREYREKIAKLQELEEKTGHLSTRAAAIADYQRRLDALQACGAIDREPLRVTHTTYITFTLDRVRYSYSSDDNPFFPFHWSKKEIVSGRYDAGTCCREDKKAWLDDCYFMATCTDADIERAAAYLWDMLSSAPVQRMPARPSNLRPVVW